MKEEKSQFVRRLFATIAVRYDLFNAISSLTLDQRWRRLAVAECRLAPGMRVLDVCTGTGELALTCAPTVNGAQDGRVVGLDVCEPMLQIAHRKAGRRGQRVTWLFGDAMGLPFLEGAFHRIVVGFSTRNLANLSLGLREMHRVLQPGGRLVILETGKPTAAWLRAGYFLYLRTVVVLVGALLFWKLWPFTYFQRSVARFWEPHEFVRALREIGFASATHRPLAGGVCALYVAVKS